MIVTAKQMADNLNVIISDSGRSLNEMANGNFAITTEHEDRYTGKFNDLLIGLRNMNRKMDEALRQVEETAAVSRCRQWWKLCSVSASLP